MESIFKNFNAKLREICLTQCNRRRRVLFIKKLYKKRSYFFVNKSKICNVIRQENWGRKSRRKNKT